MRIFQFTTFYKSYLDHFYKQNSDIANSDYNTITEKLYADGFSASHYFALEFKKIGYETMYVVANDFIAQKKWLSENSFLKDGGNLIQTPTGGYGAIISDEMLEILLKQINSFEPDILYLQDSTGFDSRFVRMLDKRPKLIAAWRAASIPKNTDWSEVDIFLSNFKPFLYQSKILGAKNQFLLNPGFPAWVNSRIRDVPFLTDISFSGQLSNEHIERLKTLSLLADHYNGSNKCISFYCDEIPGLSPLMSRHCLGSVWGMQMYRALKQSRISLNSHIDVTKNMAGNMRLFEATGVGSFLLTDSKENITDFFTPGSEIETYRCFNELTEKLDFYLKNDDQRNKIAIAGQKKCLSKYTLEHSTKQLEIIFQSKLASKLSSSNAIKLPNYQNDEIENAERLIKIGDFKAALVVLNRIKNIKYNLEKLDYYRALSFYKLGKMVDALEAVKEALRYFPNDAESHSLSSKIESVLPAASLPSDVEFRRIYELIKPYTMVGVERLYSLFSNAKRICEQNAPGNFVECGVAAGGSSAMLGYVIKKYSRFPRKLFSFDTFEGMPDAGEKDFAFGISAQDTGWGKGTCAAPMESLEAISKILDSWDCISAFKGFFADTLPVYHKEIGQIALLHADGDWYESTMDIFRNLYDAVLEDGFIQIDDYGYWDGCKRAIHDFESEKGVKFHLNVIDATGVSFTKKTDQNTFGVKLLPKSWNLPKKADSTKPPPNLEQTLKPRLNLGCGNQIHTEWTNVDIMPRHPGVINHDLNKRLPFGNESFEVVYHSHVLEHLTKAQGKAFLAECFRVLKHGGILRVVVPDLERIARLYLENLDNAEEGDERASARHEWMLLELLDQMARETSGGEMGRYFQLNPMPAEDFVIERFGHQVLEVIKPMRANPAMKNRAVPPLPRQIDAMEAARFRQSGEIHKWMYDRRSLGRLLADSGFSQISVRRADESVVPDFEKYHFDRMPDGSTRKPDSLFMEAFKP
jgi:predicted SAM-dependent methyltransferase/tetratricopeptide (TPR) repeat protein